MFTLTSQVMALLFLLRVIQKIGFLFVSKQIIQYFF